MRMDHRFHVNASFYIYGSLLLLILPFWWFAAMILCVLCHESFHILAAKMLGVRIHGIELTARGVIINTPPLSAVQELLCAAAGPIGGLMPVVLMRYFPELALIAIALTVYNLLPFYPLDGGRILRSILSISFPSGIGEKVHAIFEYIAAAAVAGLSCFLAYQLHVAFLLILLFLLPWLRRKIEKHLANKKQKRYNIPITDEGVTL